MLGVRSIALVGICLMGMAAPEGARFWPARLGVGELVGTSAYLADADGDGRLDVVSALGATLVAQMRGGQSFELDEPTAIRTFSRPVRDMVDVNFDGRRDVWLGDGVSLAHETGEFGPEILWPVGDATVEALAQNTVRQVARAVVRHPDGLVTEHDVGRDGALGPPVTTHTVFRSWSDPRFVPIVSPGFGTGVLGAASGIARVSWSNGSAHGVPSGQGFAIADVDGDGLADVVAGEYWRIRVAFGRSDGSFTTPEVVVTEFPSENLAAIDLGDDGKSEIVFSAWANPRAGLVSVAWDEERVPQLEAFPVGELYQHSLDHGDIDGDGAVDVMVHGYRPYLSFQMTSGQFSTAERRFQETRFGWPVLGDLDGDGVDWVVAEARDSVATMHSFRIGESLGDPVVSALTDRPAGRRHLVDLDGDERLDILDGEGNTLRSLGGGAFESLQRGPGWGAFVPGDVDEDGDVDAVGVRGSLLVVLENAGDGTWLGERPILNGVSVSSAGVGDLNGDGTLDVVVTGRGGIQVLRGASGAPFSVDDELSHHPFLESAREILLVEDVDGDGDVDVILGEREVVLAENDGTGRLSLRSLGELDLESDRNGPVRVADVTGDRIPDIVVLARAEVRVFRRVPDGYELEEFGYGYGHSVTGFVIADVTRDDVADIVLAELQYPGLTVFRGVASTGPAVSGSLAVVETSPFNAPLRLRNVGGRRVTAAVFDVSGRRVRTLTPAAPDGDGIVSIDWNGRDVAGRMVAPGVYFVQARAGAEVVTRSRIRLGGR